MVRSLRSHAPRGAAHIEWFRRALVAIVATGAAAGPSTALSACGLPTYGFVGGTGGAGDGGVATDAAHDGAVCANDMDCANAVAGPKCDVASGRCVQCLTSPDTCQPGKYCTPQLVCVEGCKAANDCTPPLTCDPTQHQCICQADQDCPLGEICAPSPDAGTAKVCVAGCSPTQGCPMSEACCTSTCANLAFDAKNCGTCAHDCGTPPNASATCAGGSCKLTCSLGFQDCNMVYGDGCEVNVKTDSKNCGMCGNDCTLMGKTCSNGTCT
jgi:hypothetical protein